MLLAAAAATQTCDLTSTTKTQVWLLGSGIPQPIAARSSSAIIIVKNNEYYTFDAGSGITRRATAAPAPGPLSTSKMSRLFLTHLHSDHTVGLADFFLCTGDSFDTRTDKLKVWGPKGTQDMVTHMYETYAVNIADRNIAFPDFTDSWRTPKVHEIDDDGTDPNFKDVIHHDDNVKITAIKVHHGGMIAYSYKIEVDDGVIVISGDRDHSNANLVNRISSPNLLFHEVFSKVGNDDPANASTAAYFPAYHVDGYQLGADANVMTPAKLVLYHQIGLGQTLAEVLSEVTSVYAGVVINGADFDCYNP